MPWDRSVFIAQLNIEHFRAQLLTMTDCKQRRQIEALLAEEEGKLASLLVAPLTGVDIMTDVTPVPRLDIDKYLGRWYEICRLPLRWEDETATDITATYSLNEDGNVRVDNRCFDEDGKPSQAVGEAVPVDDAKSRLKVTFLPEYVRWIPFTKGDYWVLKIDPNYRTALVGTPDRKYLWVLSREPHLSEETKSEYLAEAHRQGFDLSRLITPRHTGREVTDEILEDT